MKKIITVVALMVNSINSYAASLPANDVEVKEIVTPSVATGFYRTQNFTYDKDMNILICPMNMNMNINYESERNGYSKTCTDNKGQNKWQKMENAVPNGKKFVGFKSVSQAYIHLIEIYYK